MLISIIVPVYMVEDQLARCLDSIINQTYTDLEIILVDDGSPDTCPQMCDEYARRDSRIRVIHKINGGLSDARNAGLKSANGTYVMYVDSDDYLEIDACERLYAAAASSKVDVVVGACREVRSQGTVYQKHSNLQEGRVYTSREYVIESIKANEWYAPAVLNLYRREFLIENGLYFRVGYLFEDTEILLRLFLAAKTVVYVDYPFYNYVIREGSITTSSVTDKKREMAIRIYSGWKNTIDDIEDEEYKRYLYGVLIKYYLTSCRRLQIRKWCIQGLNTSFALKYSLSIKEKLKCILFILFPRLYTRI